MTSILSLAPEILCEIGSQLSPEDNQILRLVCSEISSAIESFALSRLVINADMENYDATVEKLEAYAKRTTRAAHHVRTVTIHSLAPGKKPPSWTSQEYFSQFVPYNSRYPYTPREGSEPNPILVRDNDFQHIFAAALAELDNISSLSWATSYRDPHWAFAEVSKFLIRRHIHDFSISFRHGVCQNIAFSGPYSLRTLKIDHIAYLEALEIVPDVVKQLAVLVETSPDLQELHIATKYYDSNPERPGLHDFLPKHIAKAPLPLIKLVLDTVQISLDDNILYHLRSLESLSIHFGYNTKKLGSTLPTIMQTLRTENIYLTTLDVNILDVCDQLLNYLTSYTGIQALIFNNGRDRLQINAKDTDPFAVQFFEVTLPAISSTLELLHLETTIPGKWCFYLDNARAIGECKQLTDLTVSVVDHVQTHSEDVVLCLHKTAKQLPKLRHLRVVDVATVPQIG